LKFGQVVAVVRVTPVATAALFRLVVRVATMQHEL
jgi:hypothetical protein